MDVTMKEVLSTNTVSTLFFVRPLQIITHNEPFTKDADIYKKYGFKNAYIAEESHINTLSHPVYLVFEPQNMWEFKNLLDREYEKGYLIEDYNLDKYTILLYNFPEEYHRDYSLVRRGKYSKTSDNFKALFPDKVANKYPSLPYMILTKDELLKRIWYENLEIELGEEDEYWRAFEIERETFKIENL